MTTRRTKKSKSGLKVTDGNTDEKEVFRKKAAAAYTKWRYYKDKLKKESNGIKTPVRPQRKNKDYLFYYELFRKPDSRLERLYINRKKHMIKASRVFTEYQTRILQVLDKYGTNVDRDRFERLVKKEF